MRDLGVQPLVLALPVLFVLGCPADDDDDSSFDCPEEDRFTALPPPDACGENFCGAPAVWPATGASPESFAVLEAGGALSVVFGPQGGYHIDLAVRMQNLCPVVFVDFELFDATGGGRTLLHSSRRHVQAVREEDADPPSLQRWWVEQFRFPCAYWPDDPVNDPPCADAPIAFIEDLDLVLRVAAEDHNEDRVAEAEVAVRAVYAPPVETGR